MFLQSINYDSSDVLHVSISTKSLLVELTFVKRRKLICKPYSFLKKQANHFQTWRKTCLQQEKQKFTTCLYADDSR